VSTGAGAGGFAVPQLAKTVTKVAKQRTKEIDERFMINLLPGGKSHEPSNRAAFSLLSQVSGCDRRHAAVYSLATASAAPDVREKKVLILDNNESILETFQDLLKDTGFDTHTTCRRREAETLLQSTEFDVLLVDPIGQTCM
jgi:hypothetical protein